MNSAPPAALTARVDGPEGAPSLILLHSLGLDGQMWAPQAGPWSKSRRVVRIDFPGHGRSRVGPNPTSLEGIAARVMATVDEFGISDFDLCGLSLGGQVALRIALDHPGRVKRLAACATGAKIGGAEGWNARIDAVKAGGMASIAELALSRFFAPGFGERDPAAYAASLQTLSEVDAEAYIACCEALRDGDLREEVKQLRLPTLLLAGAEDVSTPPATLGELEQAIPGSRLEVLPGAAHILALEAPDAVTELIESFLDSAR